MQINNVTPSSCLLCVATLCIIHFKWSRRWPNRKLPHWLGFDRLSILQCKWFEGRVIEGSLHKHLQGKTGLPIKKNIYFYLQSALDSLKSSLNWNFFSVPCNFTVIWKKKNQCSLVLSLIKFFWRGRVEGFRSN